MIQKRLPYRRESAIDRLLYCLGANARAWNLYMPVKYTDRHLLSIIPVLLLCSCTSLPVTEENAVIAQIPDPQSTDLVLTKRVILEPEKEERRIYVSQNIVSVMPTSNFGKANEVANMDCVVTGLQEILLSINIVTPSEFWEAVGDNIETLKLMEVLDEPYLRDIGRLNIDYLIIAFHKFVDKFNGFGEYVAFGGVNDINLEVASAVIVDMSNLRIIDATEIAGTYDTLCYIFYFVPVCIFGKPEVDPCTMTGKHAAAVISRAHDENTAPRIAVVAALTNPYTEVTGIEHDYVPIGEKLGRYGRSSGNKSVESRAEGSYTGGIAKEAGIYCANADLGHDDAQAYIGDLYYIGAYSLDKNLTQAYVWYSLAANKGNSYATQQIRKLESDLSPSQLIEANYQLEHWEPGHCQNDLLEATVDSQD